MPESNESLTILCVILLGLSLALLSRVSTPPQPYDVEVGPIWNHEHAKQKAEEYIREHPELRWTGQWATTVPGKMSVIQVVRRT